MADPVPAGLLDGVFSDPADRQASPFSIPLSSAVASKSGSGKILTQEKTNLGLDC